MRRSEREFRELNESLSELLRLTGSIKAESAGTRKALDEMNAAVTKRIDSLEARLSGVAESQRSAEKKQNRQSERLELQQEQIDSLRCKLDTLVNSDAVIWRDRYNRQRVGLDRDSVYTAINELGIKQTDALRALSDCSILDRGDRTHNSRNIRMNRHGDVIRAIVVYADRIAYKKEGT